MEFLNSENYEHSKPLAYVLRKIITMPHENKQTNKAEKQTNKQTNRNL